VSTDDFFGPPDTIPRSEESSPHRSELLENQSDVTPQQGHGPDSTNSSLNIALMVWNSRPRRMSEIWALDRGSNSIVALGMEGLIQLNPMASSIWLRMDGKHTVGTIVRNLIMAYPDQDPNEIAMDIMAFISQMVGRRSLVLNWVPL
jgi:hypothetical protein